MKKRIKNLSPELLAKYREWLAQQSASGDLRFIQDGEIDATAITATQTEDFLRWLGEAEHRNNIEYEDSEDDESEEIVRPAELKRYDMLTRYFLDHGLVADKRNAHFVQFGVLILIVFGGLILALVLK